MILAYISFSSLSKKFKSIINVTTCRMIDGYTWRDRGEGGAGDDRRDFEYLDIFVGGLVFFCIDRVHTRILKQ